MRAAPLRSVKITLLDERVIVGRGTGDVAAWTCPCKKDPLPLVATPKFYTVCPECERRYKFIKDAGHRHGGRVEEVEGK